MNFSFKNLSISYFFIQNSSSKWNHCSQKKNGLGLPILLEASSVSISTSSLIFAIQLIISLNIFDLDLNEKCSLYAFFLRLAVDTICFTIKKKKTCIGHKIVIFIFIKIPFWIYNRRSTVNYTFSTMQKMTSAENTSFWNEWVWQFYDLHFLWFITSFNFQRCNCLLY